MGTAILAGSVTYTTSDGMEIEETLAAEVAYALSTFVDVHEAGAATFPVPFGSITSAKLIIIKILSGTAEVLIDAEVAGHDELELGTWVLAGSDISQLDLKHTADLQAEVTVLGDA